MKKKIIGFAVVILMGLGVDSLKADNTVMGDANCYAATAVFDNYGYGGKNIKTNKKITLVNNSKEEVTFSLGFLIAKKNGEPMVYERTIVSPNKKQIVSYCMISHGGDKVFITDINGYFLERDFYPSGKGGDALSSAEYDKLKIRPLHLKDTFKKLQDRGSFNLVITVNEVGKDPVVEIK